MKKFKLYKLLCLTLGLGIVLSGTVTSAATDTKTFKASYRNIGVSYNGQSKLLSNEPFIVNGTTYASIRAISEILGMNISFANNTIYINGQSVGTAVSEQELAAKNFEIASLKQQLEAVKKELETYKGTGTTGTTAATGSNLTTAAINSTLTKITDTYSEDNNIDWDFDIKQVSGRLELTVVYDSRYDDKDFDKLSESKRKQFIKEICYDIANLHKDVEIRGTLKDNRSDREIADFRYSKSGSYEYNEKSVTSLKELETKLERSYSNINTGAFTVSIDRIDLEENRTDELIFTLTTNLRPTGADYRVQWNGLSSSNQRNVEDALYNIKEYIEDEFDTYDTITGVIKDSSGNKIGSYDDERFTLYSVSTN